MARPDARETLLATARGLIVSGEPLAGARVAALAGVAESTLFRHFPDLGVLAVEAMRGLWPGAPAALTGTASDSDPASRVAVAVATYLRHLHRHRAGIEAVIASAAQRPHDAVSRVDLRDDLLRLALAPDDGHVLDERDEAVLLRGLRLLTSAGGFFAAVDRLGLGDDPESAVQAAAETAGRLTRSLRGRSASSTAAS